MNRPTHTLNPNTGREIQINGARFWNLLKHGFKYNEKLNHLYDTPMPLNITKYVPKSSFFLPAIVSRLLENLCILSYSMTTIDHEAANG